MTESGGDMVSHYSFDFHFPEADHLCIIFHDMSVQNICPVSQVVSPLLDV